MRRTLPEERKRQKKKTVKKKKTTKKKVAKKKATKKKAIPQEELVTYKSGKTVTYAEFIKRFTARTKYIMKKRGLKLTNIDKIKYVNSCTAHVSFKDGKWQFVYIGEREI